MHVRLSTTLLLLTCTLFAAAGAASRLLFESVHTRFQIAAFCAAAVLLQLAAPRLLFLRRASGAAKFAFVWNAAAATVAIVATRVALEGVPYKVVSVLNAIGA